ncbi:MAG: gfo/Idh/MocA family oxidoreductase, partial [Verrucomicrobiae bacterium]|nr:gfo/Idh/MocA family oxidoreductase [Verrucomicrobiae bacterium]
VTADHTGMNDHVWPAQETLTYVFPGTEYTAGDRLTITWYDGGRRPRWKIPGLPPADTLLQPASMIIGEKGYLLVPHWGTPKLYPEKDFAGYTLPDPGKANHWSDWVDACLEGNTEISDNFSYAGPLSEAVQLGNVAVRFKGQTLQWNPEKLEITNLPEANAFLTKAYREGWAVDPA